MSEIYDLYRCYRVIFAKCKQDCRYDTHAQNKCQDGSTGDGYTKSRYGFDRADAECRKPDGGCKRCQRHGNYVGLQCVNESLFCLFTLHFIVYPCKIEMHRICYGNGGYEGGDVDCKVVEFVS